MSQIKIGNCSPVTNNYDHSKRLVTSREYGNGYKTSYAFDEYDPISGLYENDMPRASYQYDAKGNILSKKD